MPTKARVANRSQTARERLVLAARSQIKKRGVGDLTVAKVCEAAGLSRATFYLHFASRDEVLLAVFLEEAAAVLADAAEVAAAHDNFGDLCVETVLHGLGTIRTNPWLGMMFADERASVTARLATTSEAFLEMALAFWAPLVDEAMARGEVRPGLDVAAAVRWLLRVFLSYLENDDIAVQGVDAVRRELRSFLLPSFLVPAGVSPGAPAPETDNLVGQVERTAEELRVAVTELRRHVGSNGATS